MKKILICLLIFSSCVSNNNRTQQQEGGDAIMPELPYNVSLEKEIDNIKQAGLSEVGSAITYIPLETTDQSLLRDIDKIIVTDSFIVVKDRDKVLMFDSAGKFLRQIGRKGGGPGEYSMVILDYFFSSDETKIYLLVESSKCLEFDKEGKYQNTYRLDSMPVRILPMKNDLFVYHCQNSTGSPIEQSLIISDLNNNIQKTYKNYHKRVLNSGLNITINTNSLYIYQENIRFKEFGCDTLYTVTENELTPYCILDLGKKEIPPNFSVTNMQRFVEVGIRDDYPGCYYVSEIRENVDNLFITFTDIINDLYGFVDKHTLAVKIIGDNGFRNDIDGGLPFFPKYVYNGNVMVNSVQAFKLREHVLTGNAAEMRRLYGQKYDDLVKLVNSIDDESNPIVVMVKK